LKDIEHINWRPKTHEEFRKKVAEGLIAINIDDYYWNEVIKVVPWDFRYWFVSYKKKVLKHMIANADVFWKLHGELNVDLILFKVGG